MNNLNPPPVVAILRQAEDAYETTVNEAKRRRDRSHDEIGLKLSTWRNERSKACGLLCSQARVAKQMGCSSPYVSGLETGRNAWTEELIGSYVMAVETLTGRNS